MASPDSSSPAEPAPSSEDLVLRFRGESWVDVVDQAGAPIERGLVAAGDGTPLRRRDRLRTSPWVMPGPSTSIWAA